MKNGLKLGFITLPVAAIGAGILAYLVSINPPPERIPVGERSVPVRVITAKSQQISPSVSGFGLVTPAHSFEAISQVSGTVTYVNPALVKGEILPKGSILWRLSPLDFNLAIAQADANIRATQARLAELKVSEANQIAALEIEEESLTLKARDLERIETLFANGTVPQSTLDAARSAHLGQRQKVQTLKSALALFPTQRTVQQEQAAVYQASLETAKLNLERTELTLPFAARVASVSVETGQFLSAGKTSAILDGIDSAEVEALVPVAVLRRFLQSARPDGQVPTVDPTQMTTALRNLDLGVQVRLTLGQETLIWPATLDRISDVIDPKTGTLGVIVKVASAYSGAKPGDRPPLTKGMFVEVDLKAKPVNGIAVPRSALQAGNLMIVDKDNRLALLPVEPFLIQDGIAVIIEGLDEGTPVVVSKPTPSLPGLLLEPQEDTGLIERLLSEGRLK